MSENEDFIRATLITAEEQQIVDQALRDLQQRVYDTISRVLARIPTDALKQLTYETAFKPGPLLPKRDFRPLTSIGHLTEQVYWAYQPDGPHAELLLDFAISVQEYYDILDDVIDGDVAEGKAGLLKAVLVSQLLLPNMIQVLGELGAEATRYFGGRAMELVRSVYEEKLREKSLEAYLGSLRSQSWFFGYCTGLSAVVAGQEPEVIAEAEEIGRVCYQWAQFLLDLHQQDDPDTWNALHFMTPDEALKQMQAWYQEICDRVQPLPDRPRLLIRGLFSLDLDKAAEELRHAAASDVNQP